MTHRCYGQCPEYKGEQCNHCLINDHEELAVDDVVVFVDSNMPSKLMTVSAVSPVHYGVMLNKDQNFTLSHLLRRATLAEKKHGFRMPEPAMLFVENLPFVNKPLHCVWDPANEKQ